MRQLRVLLPHDGSQRSDPSVLVALALAEHGDLDVTVVHAVDGRPWYPPSATSLLWYGAAQEVVASEAQRTQDWDYIEQVAGILRSNGIKTETLLAMKPVRDVLVELATDHDLVLMTSRSPGGLFNLGSQSDRLMREVSTPVLLTDSDSVDVDLQRVALLLSEADLGDEDSLEGAVLHCARFGLPLHIYIAESQQPRSSKATSGPDRTSEVVEAYLKDILHRHLVEAKTHFLTAELAEIVETYTAASDLVVLLAAERGRVWRNLVLGDHNRVAIRTASSPVMLLDPEGLITPNQFSAALLRQIRNNC